MIITINVQMKNLPTSIKAMTTPNIDGSYTIFLNSRLTYEQQREGYLHEIEHIFKCDHEKESVNSIELDAHRIAR